MDLIGRSFPRERGSWLKKFESSYGPLPSGGQNADEIPLAEMMGTARVLDVRTVAGTTGKGDWPASPVITAAHIVQAEAKAGAIAKGDVVILRTGYVDAHFKPIPDANRFFADPLAGEAEAWPALGLDALEYLTKKGVRCLGIDAPTAGGIDPEHAQMVSWLASSRKLHIVEFLTGIESIADQDDAYFIFAPIKIRDSTGGYGRALAIY